MRTLFVLPLFSVLMVCCTVASVPARKTERLSVAKEAPTPEQSAGRSVGAVQQFVAGDGGSKGEPWWANRLAPPSTAIFYRNEPVPSVYRSASVAAVDLFAPLDALRAFTWEKLWIKHPEDPALDELILRGSVLVVWSDYYVGEEHKGPLWFYLGRTGDCPAETVLVARWVEMGQTSRDPESEYREALEEILRTSRVTELACKTGGLSELNALAEAIDDLTFPATLKCDDYLYRPGERLPAFVFRLFGGGGRSTKMLGGVDCGEGEAHGNLLAWYARAMKVLAKLRKAVEEERLPWGWCSLATEDGLTFLEKRPPHSPIDWEVDLWRGLTWEPAKP